MMTDPEASSGLAALAAGEWEIAETSLQEVLERDAGNTDANFGMASMALHAGYAQDALDFLKNAENQSDPRIEALATECLNRLGPALESWREKGLKGGLQLGGWYAANSRWADVRRIFLEVCEEYPNDPMSQSLLATACLKLGRMDECRAAMRRRLDLLPDDAVAHSQWVGIHSGKPDLGLVNSTSLPWRGIAASVGIPRQV